MTNQQLSTEHFQQQIDDARKAINAIENEKRKEAIDQILGLMMQFKIHHRELRGLPFRPKPAVKYYDPVSGQSWTGRGLPARWVREYENVGRQRSEFLLVKESVL